MDDSHSNPLINADLAPVSAEERTWSRVEHRIALWVGMAVCIPTYMLAAGMISQGMNWWQATLTVMAREHDRADPDDPQRARRGRSYGVPFPVLVAGELRDPGRTYTVDRAIACGVRLVRDPVLDRRGRALLRSSWCSAWIVQRSVETILRCSQCSGSRRWQLGCFLAFWLLHVVIVVRGDGIDQAAGSLGGAVPDCVWVRAADLGDRECGSAVEAVFVEYEL